MDLDLVAAVASEAEVALRRYSSASTTHAPPSRAPPRRGSGHRRQLDPIEAVTRAVSKSPHRGLRRAPAGLAARRRSTGPPWRVSMVLYMRSSECPPSDRRENVNAVSGSTPYARLAGRARSYRDPNVGGRRTDASGCVGRRSHGDRSTVSEWTPAAFVPARATCAHDLCSHADDQLIGFAYDPKCIRLALQGFAANTVSAPRRWATRLRMSAPSGTRVGPALRRCPPGASPWPLRRLFSTCPEIFP